MKTFTLPDLGEGLQEAEIVAWHVSAGDRVIADQPLVSVETDKAVVEVPAPWSGTVVAIHGEVGDVVSVGAPLTDFEETPSEDTGALVGELEQAEAGKKVTKPKKASGKVKAAPAVRALATELGVDLASVHASGPNGSITRADVEKAGKGDAIEIPEGYEPLRGPRRAMAQNMVRSGAEIVPATLTDDADVHAWWSPEIDVTVRLVRAMVRACEAEGALNAWYDGAQLARKLHKNVDLGIAIDSAEGLFVPVLREVGGKEAAQLRSEIDALREKIKSRRVTPDTLRGPTMTLSNFGTMAGRYAALAIMPPQVAILGVGRIRPETVPIDGEIVIRLCMPLSLTFDHRAVTGGEAARFMTVLIEDLERND